MIPCFLSPKNFGFGLFVCFLVCLFVCLGFCLLLCLCFLAYWCLLTHSNCGYILDFGVWAKVTDMLVGATTCALISSWLAPVSIYHPPEWPHNHVTKFKSMVCEQEWGGQSPRPQVVPTFFSHTPGWMKSAPIGRLEFQKELAPRMTGQSREFPPVHTGLKKEPEFLNDHTELCYE